MKQKRDKGLRARWKAGQKLWRNYGWAVGFGSTVLFALYNGALGLLHGSVWHGSICGYYLLLSALRGVLLAAEVKGGSADARRGIFRLTVAMLLLMNAALSAPIALMVLDRRPVRLGMIPAIATAAYTTYKIAAACIQLKRTDGSLFIRELALLRVVDALVSILVLQNTLITAVEGQVGGEMRTLSALTSAGILLAILLLCGLFLVRNVRRNRQKITP